MLADFHFVLLTLSWQLSRVRNSLSCTRGYARTPSCINLSQPWSPPCYSTEYNLGTVLHHTHPTASWVFERSHLVMILNITLWSTPLGKCGSLPCYSGYWWYLGQCRRWLRIRRRFGTVRNGKHDVTVIFTVMCLRSASNRYSPKSFLRLMLWCKWWSCVLFGWYQVFFELACTHWFIHFHSYNQKVHDHLFKLSPLLARLSTTNGGYSPKVIIIHAIPHPEDRSHWLAGWLGWETFLEEGRKCKLGLTSEGEVEWKRLPFDAPLWILFSSGTTGKPKCVILQRNTNLQDINVTLLGLLFIEQEACWFRPRKNSLYVVIYDRKMFSSTILPRSLFLILIPRRVISHFLQGLDDVELSCQRVMYRKHSCLVRWQSLAWYKPAVEPRRWPWHFYLWN